MDHKLGIEKLTNENYPQWSFEAEMLLEREDLWKYVVDAAPNPVTAAWTSGDRKARATIALLVEKRQHPLIRDAKSAKDTWDRLKTQHQKTTMCSRVSLICQICDKKLPEGGDLEVHIYELEELFSRLHGAGKDLGEDVQVAILLRSLPASYENVRTALLILKDEELKMSFVKGKVLDFAQKLLENETVVGESALKIEAKNLICHSCGKKGHKRRDCPANKSSHQVRAGDKNPRFKNKSGKDKSYAFVLDCADGKKADWIIDSGASSHVCCDRSFFEDLKPSAEKSVFLANGKEAKVQGTGTVKIFCVDSTGDRTTVTLSDVLYVPGLEMNLISVSKLIGRGANVQFGVHGCQILSKKEVVAVAVKHGGLYRLKIHGERAMVAGQSHTKDCQHTWHRRFGHREEAVVQQIVRKDLASGIQVHDCGIREECEPCLEGKQARKPFAKSTEKKSTAVLDLIHTDVCGSMETSSISGFKYFVTLIDDHSRFCVLYFLKKKSEVPEKIQDYVEMVKTQHGRTPKAIRSDNGGEFTSAVLRKFYQQNGILPQYTTSYSPQSNGVAERRNRYLSEMTRCMLADAKLHDRFWAEAMNTAVYLQNVLPSRSIEVTPHELWYGHKPDMKHLRVFGSPAYVHVPKQRRKKLSPVSQKMTFVGYSVDHKAWRFLDMKTFKLVISRDADFMELSTNGCDVKAIEDHGTKPDVCEFDLHQPTSAAIDDEENFEIEDIEPSNVEDDDDLEEFESAGEFSFDTLEQDADETITPRRSTRTTKGIPPLRYGEITGAVVEVQEDPRSYTEAVNGPERDQWLAAMQEELDSLAENRTWEMAELPPGRKAVGSRWIFKRKTNEYGEVVRYKARLVAQGFSQRYGLDYEEVFAPVVKQATFRILLTVAARENLLIKHVDIKTANLYGELQETIYMKLPQGMESSQSNAVCRLKKSLYGLKQAGRVWNKTLDEVLTKMGFVASTADPCLYQRKTKKKQIFITVYVDDMVVACSNETEFQEIMAGLQKRFKMSLLGDLKLFLGMHIEMNDGCYQISQTAYISKMAEKFGLKNAKPSTIPMDPGYIQRKEEDSQVLPRNDEYQSLIGALLYVSVMTRPDVAIAASILGRKVSNPTNADWIEAKRVVRYLYATRDLRLTLGVSKDYLKCYVDADWAGDTSDRKSNSGYLVFFGGGLISWGARKQNCVALSSTEAEFVALAESCQELLWLQKLLHDYGEINQPILIMEDNQSCIRQLEGERIEKRSKHIDTKYAFAKDLKKKEVIKVEYCPTSEQTADMMTKPLSRVKLQIFREASGLKPIKKTTLEEEC